MKKDIVDTTWRHKLRTFGFTAKLPATRPFLRLFAFLTAVLVLGSMVIAAQAATVAKTNSEAGSADASALERSVTFTSGDFVAGALISDVNVAVTFEKIDGTCPQHDGGSPFNREIYAFLTSPAGTQVALIEDQLNSSGSNTPYTYSSGATYGGQVTVQFDDSAGTAVGGPAPASGSFRPVQPLDSFNSESPVGQWTLTIGDSGFSDPLCFFEYTLSIEADQPPAVEDQSFDVAENSANGTVVGTVVASDPDAGDKLTYAITAGNSNGVFAIDSNSGEITVANGSELDFDTPPTTYSLTVQVTDSSLLPDTAIITIHVTDENESPPVVDDQSFSVAENSADGVAVGTVIASDADAGDVLSYAITGGDPGGVFAIDGGSGEITVADSSQLDFEAMPGYSLAIQVTDSALQSDTATVTINVTNVNEPPAASDDTFTIAEDSANGASVGTVSATDPDNGDTLGYAISGGDPGGVFAINSSSGEITVADGSQLDHDSTSSYSLTVTVTDSGALSDTAIITINVTDVNEAPVVGNQSFSVAENSADGLSVGTVVATDPDSGDVLSYAISGGDPGGVFAINSSSGEITVVDGSQLDYETTTSYSLTVQVTDTEPQSTTATVTITVTNVNEFAPVVNDQLFTVDEDSTNGASVDVVEATDADGIDSLSYAISGGDPGGAFAINSSSGAITVADSSQLDFETTPGYSLTVQVTDSGGLQDTAIITIEVIDVNESPSAVDDTNTTDEDTPLSESAPGVLSNDSDPEDDALSVMSYDASSANGAAVTVNADGSYSYDPAAAPALQALAVGESLIDTFTYTAGDGQDNEASATVSITVNGVNDAPTAVADSTSTPEDTPVTILALINDVDVDGDSLSITNVGTPSSGTAASGGATIVYTPTLDFIGVATFTYDVADGHGGTDSASVTVNVGAVNDSPVAIDDDDATDEDTILTVPAGSGLLDNDTDPDPGDTLAVVAFDGVSASGADVTVSANGSYTYNPTVSPVLQALQAAEVLVDTFSYAVSDSGGLQDTATVSITVTGINDVPLAVDDAAATQPETPVIVAVLENDTDVDKDSLSISAVTQGSYGAVVNNGDGTVTYTPGAGFSGSDTFTYTISDGHDGSDSATVTINVGQHHIFLPLITSTIATAPDLVVTSVSAGNDVVEVVIKNQGNAATVDAFWVDFYVDPSPVPNGANQLWQDVSAQGIVWGVTVSLAPGETLALIYSSSPGAPNLYYSAPHSSFAGALPAGTPIYAQVDSAHLNTAYGGVLESHEVANGPYNNVSSQATAE